MSKGLYGSFPLATFQSKLAQKEVHRACILILKSAVKAWVTSAKDSTNRIPIWSGMAMGSIVKVGRLVGLNVSTFPLAASASPPKGPGARGSEGISLSNARLVIVPGRYGFEWSSDVPHLAFNDQVDANAFGFNLTHTPRPWEFKINADQAFDEEMRKGLDNFPFARIIGASLKLTNKRLR